MGTTVRTVRGRGRARTDLPVVWTSEEVAARWGISNELVCSMFLDGRVMGAFKVGRWWRIREDALEEYERRSGGFGTLPAALTMEDQS